MEAVKIEHLTGATEVTMEETLEEEGDKEIMEESEQVDEVVPDLNGDEQMEEQMEEVTEQMEEGGEGDTEQLTEEQCQQHVSTDMNGQLEIEIPAGESREGAIHTIQLQSPGGNTHFVEGLVVTSAGGVGGGEEGETTAIFHPATTGAFLLPSHAHNNNMTSTTALMTTSTSSPQTCEMITADPSEHHFVSGLQVVRVTSGENGETIFLVPSSATGGGDKDGMQQVMVLQSTGGEELQDENVHIQQEVVEESVELNIPSPKPVLTTVKQEHGLSNETAAVAEALKQHYQQQNATHLVVVTGSSAMVTQTMTSTDVKPVVTTAGEATPAKKTPTPRTPRSAPVISNGPSIADDRPKRKAALKAVATRKAALASASPRKQSSQPRAPKKKPEPKPAVEVKAKGTTSAPVTPVNSITNSQPTTGLIGNTARALFNFPPPPPIVTTPSHKAILAAGPQKQATPTNYFLLPEDLVSDSDEEADGNVPRRCVVCLRKTRFTEDIFEGGSPDMSNGRPLGSLPRHQPQLLPHMDVLIAHLNIPKTRGKSSEMGICLTCLDSLQRWHIFNCAIVKRQEDAKTCSPGSFDANPLNLEPFETRIYRNLKRMGKVKEVYKAATHSHFARRHLSERDWDFFCENLFRSSSARSEKGRALEKYLNCREKLSQLYCVKCQRMVRNGKKGFVKHMKTHHPHQPILFPCDICGSHLPEKGFGANNEDYYPHWISHFYFHTCDECGKRFPTKRSLGQHRQSVHKNRVSNWGARVAVDDLSSNEDRPWKCDQCDASFKIKAALVSHRDVIHLHIKNHVCTICGEAFKSASSLRGHVRRHEGRRDYKCEVCNKEYYTYSALKGHKVVHQTARDFVCGICNKAFKKKKALEEHGTLHTGVKPHRCPICGREIRVKSNLYKHMKIHKKNAELGITSGRGRNLGMNRNNPSASSSQSLQQHSKATPNKAPPPLPAGKGEPKVKQIRVEDRILEIKQEPTMISHFQQQQSSSGLSHTATLNNAPNLATSSSPIQGATAVDVVLENADMGNGEHRGPIVVSIVTDGLTSGPGGILQMDAEQQAQLLSAVTSFANSQGHNVTVSAGALSGVGSGPTFLTSHLPSSSSSNGTSVVSTATSAASGQDPILGVATTQFYNAQQFFTSLDQLQN